MEERGLKHMPFNDRNEVFLQSCVPVVSTPVRTYIFYGAAVEMQYFVARV